MRTVVETLVHSDSSIRALSHQIGWLIRKGLLILTMATMEVHRT